MTHLPFGHPHLLASKTGPSPPKMQVFDHVYPRQFWRYLQTNAWNKEKNGWGLFLCSYLATWGLGSLCPGLIKYVHFAPQPRFFPSYFLLLLALYNHTKMPQKKPRWAYIEDAVAEAILDVTDNGLSVRQSAQKWGVPRTTVSSRLKGQIALTDQTQPKEHLSRNQEAKLSSWILR